MKFFIGIVPPLSTKERIAGFQKSFPSNKVPYFTEPHITLKAPNGLTEDKSWLAKVMTIIGNHPRFSIKLSGLDGFEDRVLFLNPEFSQGLIDLHMKLVTLLNLDLEEQKKFYEGSLYHPHLTLGETTWGGMSLEELKEMKKKAEFEFYTIPSFQVDSVRVYQKENDEPYQKLIDIPLKF
ncbi:MAG: 2-5 ligase [Parcubacteria group bacterium]|nr:2-5 ligase [Parcubacteria group bacterium]